MHSQGQPYGHLSLVEGVPIELQTLSKLLNKSLKSVQAALKEILAMGVWTKHAESQVIFDPVLVSQRIASETAISRGSKGGNPSLLRNTRNAVNLVVNPPVNHQVNHDSQTEVILQDNIERERDREREREREAPDASELVIPTVAKVIEFGQGPVDIPSSYCEHYHSHRSENKRWLVKTAQGLDVIDWRRELARWWVKDRAVWVVPGSSSVSESDELLRQKIAASSDAAERAVLRRRLLDRQTKTT